MNELIQRRAAMMQSRSGGINWESIAKGMCDCTTSFQVPADAFGSLTDIPSNCDMFYGRKVTEIEIPATLTSLRSCFKNADKLTRVTYLGTSYTISNYIFQGCKSVQNFADVMPPNITSVPLGAFQYCNNLVSVVLNEGYTDVGPSAFIYTGYITLIDLPTTLTSIGNSAFQSATHKSGGCELICRASAPPSLGNNVFDNNALTAIYVPDASVSAYQAATNWTTYASIIKPISQRPT